MNLTPDLDTLAYHRLAQLERPRRWWRPLLVGLVAVALYVATLVVLVIATVIAGLINPAVEATVQRRMEGDLDYADPVTFALLLATVALMLPALLVAHRLVGRRPVGSLSSVAGRLRLRWLRTTTLIALALWVPIMTIWLAIEGATGTLEIRSVAPTTVFALLATTLVLVPFQAAAEEYVFRGYLAQLVGSWLRHPAFAILLPVPLFVLGHNYGILGSIDVAAFAVVCGYLAWRTGGLEAPIALHVVNNAVLMSATAVGFGDPNATETSPLGLGVSLGLMAVFTVLVTRRADRIGLVRTRELPVPAGRAETPSITPSAAPLPVG